MGEWKPIETAPKDGTEILVRGPQRDGGVYHDVQAWPDGWTGMPWPVALMDYAAGEPTHWMPLPEPPGTPSPREAAMKEMAEALGACESAIRSLPVNALGMADAVDVHNEPYQYPIRDALLGRVEAALSTYRKAEEGE